MNAIVYREGDIFTTKCKNVVIPVNVKGVMGKGLALQFKEKYPELFELYKDDCKTGKLTMGEVIWYPPIEDLYNDGSPTRKGFIMFPTKESWRAKSKMEYIDQSIFAFCALIYGQNTHLMSVAIPKVGCGEGGLDWFEVKTKLVDAVKHLAGTFEIWE